MDKIVKKWRKKRFYKSPNASNLCKKLVLDGFNNILQNEKIWSKEFREISFFYCVKMAKIDKKWREKDFVRTKRPKTYAVS